MSVTASNDKNYQLYFRQVDLLATLLAHHAISQAEHDKSLTALREKIGYPEEVKKTK